MLQWLTFCGVVALCNADCMSTLMQMQQSQSPALGNMILATAKNFPFDAGKYIMCVNIPEAKYHLVTVNAEFSGYGHDIQFGICLPEVCTSAEAESFASDAPNPFKAFFLPQLLLPGLSVSNPRSTSADDLRAPMVGTWIAVGVVALMTLLIVVSTFIHIQARTAAARVVPSEADAALLHGEEARPKPGLEKNLLFSAFSLVGPNGTWDKLWQIPAYRNTDCLNGARVLSMMWVVVGHTFLMAEGVVGYTNPEDIQLSPMNQNTAETKWIYMFLFNSQLSVDTFFWMGGFLFSFLTTQDLKKTHGKFKYVPALILRYLRLTPSLAFVMMVYYQIWPFLASGPFAPGFQDSIFRRCDISWWSELTYTMNLVPFDSDKVCMGWTWYLGDI